MSRSNYYAEPTDAAPVLKMMDEHAVAGLPFMAVEYDDNYQEWAQKAWRDLEGSVVEQFRRHPAIHLRSSALGSLIGLPENLAQPRSVSLCAV